MFFKSRSNSSTDFQVDTVLPKEPGGTPKPNRRNDRPRSANANIPPSIIAEDMHIVGNIVSDGDMQIDGVIEGQVSATAMVIGKNGIVNGKILAGKLKVFGKVKGEIRANNVTLMETADVTGDLYHRTLEMVMGACVNGLVKNQDLNLAEGEASEPLLMPTKNIDTHQISSRPAVLDRSLTGTSTLDINPDQVSDTSTKDNEEKMDVLENKSFPNDEVPIYGTHE